MLGTQHGRTCNGRGWLPIAPDAPAMKIFMMLRSLCYQRQTRCPANRERLARAQYGGRCGRGAVRDFLEDFLLTVP